MQINMHIVTVLELVSLLPKDAIGSKSDSMPLYWDSWKCNKVNNSKAEQ